MNAQLSYKKAIAEFLQVKESEVFLFWKGRVALYAILKAMGIGKGDEVIIPAFTCVVVPNAIMYLGAKPVYVDIDRDTYNMNLVEMEEKITPKTKVIIAQNTFGLSPDLDLIMEISRKHGLMVIEDCTHGFGGSYKGKLNGTIADTSFFSSQWNKPFSTGIGGFTVVKNPDLIKKMAQIELEAITPSLKEEIVLKYLFHIRNYFLPPFLYWNALRFYRFLSSKNILIGSSSGKELEKPEIVAGFLKRAGKFQSSKGIEGVKSIEKFNLRRKGIASVYEQYLHASNKIIPVVPAYAEHTFLKFPILVKDRALFLINAEKSKIELGEWFNSPIHPIQHDFQLWNYNYGENPIAEEVSSKMVNLPTNPSLSARELKNIMKFLSNNIDLIE
jgi:perosamine synthetase